VDIRLFLGPLPPVTAFDLPDLVAER